MDGGDGNKTICIYLMTLNYTLKLVRLYGMVLFMGIFCIGKLLRLFGF